jgi:two-component system KDP operon response regulator KdpE
MTKRTKAHKARILVVAAEPQIQRLLKSILTANGYRLFFETEVAAAIRTCAAIGPDLVVVDLDVPDLSRHNDAIIEMGRCADAPIIALSGGCTEAHLVAAFDRGADDYVEKPLRVAELLARIRSLLRRNLKTKGNKAVYHCEGLLIDILEHSVTRGGEPIKLKPSEFEILSLLVRNSGRVVSYQRFLNSQSGRTLCRNKQALRASIWGLRRKIEHNPNDPRIVLTEPRIGYRLARSPDRVARAGC